MSSNRDTILTTLLKRHQHSPIINIRIKRKPDNHATRRLNRDKPHSRRNILPRPVSQNTSITTISPATMQRASHLILTTRNQPLILYLIINNDMLRDINLLIPISIISRRSMNGREMNRLCLVLDIGVSGDGNAILHQVLEHHDGRTTKLARIERDRDVNAPHRVLRGECYRIRSTINRTTIDPVSVHEVSRPCKRVFLTGR